MFGDPEVNYHQTYSARDGLSILRTSYPTQKIQRKHRTGKSVDIKRNRSGSIDSLHLLLRLLPILA
jgi:hypothetical protein